MKRKRLWNLVIALCLTFGMVACGPAVVVRRPAPAPPPPSGGGAGGGAGEGTPATQPQPADHGGCAELFSKAKGRLPVGKIQCIEHGFEKRGHLFDTKSCDALENAWASGFGSFSSLWPTCRTEQKFDDADCNAVLEKCF